MDNVLDIDLIINRNKYAKVYKFSLVMLVVIIICIYIIIAYRYQTYYLLKGRIINNQLELTVSIDDIKNIYANNQLIIDNQIYNYQVMRISEYLHIDNNFQNYCSLYLNVNGLVNIDNFVYDIKIPKENKALVEYIKDYL